MIEQVGRSLSSARVMLEGGKFVARYMTRKRVVMTTQDMCKKYLALPTTLLVDTMQFEATLLQRWADQCDNYAMMRFDPPVLVRYLENLR